MKNLIYYLARVLSIIIVGFFAVFILEGFTPPFGWMDSLSHLIMALVVLGITIVAWKIPQIGGWLFVAFGVFSFWFFNAKSGMEIVIPLIPLITGLLFLAEGLFFSKNKK